MAARSHHRQCFTSIKTQIVSGLRLARLGEIVRKCEKETKMSVRVWLVIIIARPADDSVQMTNCMV